MIKKIICFIVGHKNEISKCPFSGATILKCKRCNPKSHITEMSFN